jgi:glycosyltransferase involved in cell wall biosynthesis
MTYKKLKVLVFIAYYLPGHRSGGPVRTVASFVEHLGEEFDIYIVTRDHDMGDTKPYEGISVNQWNTVGNAQVFYASNKTLTLHGITRLLCDTPYDVLYLNSFFAFEFTALPLFARRISLAPKTPCVIAPRGEFSAGAISIKGWKKRPYMALANVLNLYSDLQWQASSLFEANDIKREMRNITVQVCVAPDLPAAIPFSDSKVAQLNPSQRSSLQIVFLSRISPKKNLDFLLRVLKRVQEPINLFIYGPVEDQDYWHKCLTLIQQIPSNICVEYRGEVAHTEVQETFAHYDVFAFPTRGENFGHVILESLAAGTPVLVSDQTPWQADEQGSLQVLGLEEDNWAEAIIDWSKLTDKSHKIKREAAVNYARTYIASEVPISQNRTLFLDAIGIDKHG